MSDAKQAFETQLTGLGWTDWVDGLSDMIGQLGFVERLGARHIAAFRSKGPVLLVTFEDHGRIQEQSRAAHPLGWQMVDALGWSHLSLVSHGDTWFRDPLVYGFFDRMIDDGFFEEFDQVIFYGARACAYAAAAYSVAAPGSRVLAIQPQATLDPRIAEWDDRFTEQRRIAFDDRYGYAPDMLDAAREAFVLYDPENDLDAMHAALFTRSNVTKFRMRYTGVQMEDALMRMNILLRMLAQMSAGKLNRLNLARLYRARHNDGGYQFWLLQRVTGNARHALTVHVANHVLAQRDATPFRKALAQARLALEDDSAQSAG